MRCFFGVSVKDILTWLEKGEQNLVDKIEPKFHEGDLVVDNCGNIWKIEGIINQFYILEGVEGGESRPTIEWVNKTFHLWILEDDAKDGDVLSNGKMIVIFKHFEKPSYKQRIVAYIGLDINGNIQITDDAWNLGIDKTKPATKEEQNLLFSKDERSRMVLGCNNQRT